MDTPASGPARIAMSAHLPPLTFESLSGTSTISPQGPTSGGLGFGAFGPGDGHRLAGSRPPYDVSAPRAGPARSYHDEFAAHHAQMEQLRAERSVGITSTPPRSMMPGGSHSQKRPYRQRRKDPSCDACRERKVKCDATETSSCSECSSRNVKCQFTKETNRRMSSIKQVQDLESQLLLARQQVDQYRSMVPADQASDREVRHRYSISSSPLEYSPNKRWKPNLGIDFSTVRRNLVASAERLIKAPLALPSVREMDSMTGSLPALPLRQRADRLIENFRISFHNNLPILHWPSFDEQFRQFYATGNHPNPSRTWMSILFTVFACGALSESATESQRFIDIATGLTDICNDEPNLELVQNSLLRGCYLLECNARSAAWMTFGYAIRAAQDLGLPLKTGDGSLVEEISTQIWWSAAFAECLLALELGRSPWINELGTEVALSSPIQDRRDSRPVPNWSRDAPESLDLLIPIAQCLSRLPAVLKAPTISPLAVQHIEDHIQTIIATHVPAHLLPDSSAPLDPALLPPLLHLHNACLLLHRPYISPQTHSQSRSAALDACLVAAQNTARLIARSTLYPAWPTRLATTVTAYSCTHLWRCTLVLAHRAALAPALICARAAAAIGPARPVNEACGRHAAMFLRELRAAWRRTGTMGGVEVVDEVLLAYVSADGQSNWAQAWIWDGWNGAEEGRGPSGNEIEPEARDESNTTNEPAGTAPPVQAEETLSGWDAVVEALTEMELEAEQMAEREREKEREAERWPEASSSSSLLGVTRVAGTNVPSPGGTNRMSIADLI